MPRGRVTPVRRHYDDEPQWPELKLEFGKTVICPHCKGKGMKGGKGCYQCGGRGVVPL